MDGPVYGSIEGLWGPSSLLPGLQEYIIVPMEDYSISV